MLDSAERVTQERSGKPAARRRRSQTDVRFVDRSCPGWVSKCGAGSGYLTIFEGRPQQARYLASESRNFIQQEYLVVRQTRL